MIDNLGVTHDLTNKTITMSGVDFGQGYHAVPIHWQNGLVVVLKIPGHKTWNGIGQPPRYFPAHFLVLRLERDDGGKMRAEQLAWFPIKADA